MFLIGISTLVDARDLVWWAFKLVSWSRRAWSLRADGLGLSEPTGLALLLSTSLEINFARGGVFS